MLVCPFFFKWALNQFFFYITYLLKWSKKIAIQGVDFAKMDFLSPVAVAQRPITVPPCVLVFYFMVNVIVLQVKECSALWENFKGL